MYSTEHAFLTVQNCLLLKDMKLVIPLALRKNVLEKIPEGYQVIVKCKKHI